MIRIVPWKGAKGGWLVDVRLEGPNGERVRRRVKSPVASPSGTQRWAEALERQMLAELLDPRVRLAKKASTIPTLKEFSPRWIREYARANRQKPSGIAAKQSILNHHLLPLLGAVPLDKIGAAEAAKIKTALSGKSAKTVNNSLSVLHRLLEIAFEWNVIPNPPPRSWCLHYEAPERDFWDFEEFEKLAAAAAGSPDQRERLVVLLGAHAGLRLGEMKALTWADVDLPRQRLTVRSSEWNGHVTETKGLRVRRVPLTSDLLAALKAHRHLRSPRVITHRGGRGLTTQNIRTIVARVERAAGLRSLGPHALRHTFCSHLAMRGVAARTIQELAGHRDLKTTLGYMHLSPRALEEGIQALEARPPRGEIGATGIQPNAK